MIKPMQFLACATLATISGCAAPPGGYYPELAQSRGPACFRVNEVHGFTQGPNGIVDLQTAQGPFRMRLSRGCPDFSYIMQIGIRPRESSWLCEGKFDELITGSPVPGNVCTVSEIQSLRGQRAALSLGARAAA